MTEQHGEPDGELHRPLYVPDVLANALNNAPDRPLLHLLDGPTLSVAQVREATSRHVQALAALGVRRGTRVAVLSPNRPEVLYLANALQLLAAVAVPLHPLSSLDDHRFAVRDAGVEVLVFDPDRYAERAGALVTESPAVRALALPELAALVAEQVPGPLVAPVVGPGDPLRTGYSGGTTGKPKALVSSQRTGLVTLQSMLAEWEWPNPPRFLSCTPLSHAGSAFFLPVLLHGGSLMVLPAFQPAAVLAAIQEHRINCLMLVPTMLYALLDHPDLDRYDLSSLETVFYGAAATSPARLREAIERIGPVFMQFYGQAEAPMTITVLRRHEHDPTDLRRLASCGRPSPWIRVELQDAQGVPVPDGEPGEICVRGPLVMDGYRDNPELTAQTFAGGWLHTGDVAVRDPGGFLRIIDRTKDMIVTGGFNVYPREIEDVLGEHPAVAQAAVVGVPHPVWGEAVTAVVVLRPGTDPAPDADPDRTLLAAELTALVAERKGGYQAPKAVQFTADLPQTPLGKPDKKALQARLAAAASDPRSASEG